MSKTVKLTITDTTCTLTLKDRVYHSSVHVTEHKYVPSNNLVSSPISLM